jgi:hypothetical protein
LKRLELVLGVRLVPFEQEEGDLSKVALAARSWIS